MQFVSTVALDTGGDLRDLGGNGGGLVLGSSIVSGPEMVTVMFINEKLVFDGLRYFKFKFLSIISNKSCYYFCIHFQIHIKMSFLVCI